MAQRRRHSAEFKVKVALEAIRGRRTANEIAAEHGVHPAQVAEWKKQALDGLPQVFSARGAREAKDEEALRAALYQQIGQLKVELDWLREKGGISRSR